MLEDGTEVSFGDLKVEDREFVMIYIESKHLKDIIQGIFSDFLRFPSLSRDYEPPITMSRESLEEAASAS